MAIDLDDPIALMLAASAAFERAGMDALASEITDHDLQARFATISKP